MLNLVQLKTFTPEQVASIYQISKASVYKMIQEGKILAKKINDRQYRIPQSELAWINGGIDKDILEMDKEDRNVLDVDTVKLLKEIRKQNEQN